MKKVILISILIIAKLSFGQEAFSEKILIDKSNKIISEYNSRIESEMKKDTTYGPNYLEMTRYYDQNGKLLKRVNLNPRSSLGLTGPRTEIYDSVGNLILEKNEDHKGVIWNLSLNEYDNSGNLTKRTKFDFEHIYMEIFEYNNDNVITRTEMYDCNGRKRKSKRKTKRKEPYKIE
ncbi:hypothetical protein [Winogradskyella sp. PE311]|uniref:hypothetical protein n=1 Tax=Winogradskyella sp. PE311 TaxID=3366943 RepID=UPI00397E9A61